MSTTTVVTLYSDKEKQDVILPRTKVSAVSNENGVGLDALLDSKVSVAYATCSTAAATAEKIVTIQGNINWTLTIGSVIYVKFTETNTAQNPTLNVNDTGGMPIWYSSAVITTSSLSCAGYANRVISYLYDGTNWVFNGWSYDSNSDTKVQQNAVITTASEYPVLLGYSNSTSKVTNVVNKAAGFTYNPNTKILTAPTFKGALNGNASSATTLTGLTATVTELNYVDGVTSAIQTQLNNKLNLSGGNITGHVYLTGANTSSSTGNTSQLIFGTSSNNHLAVSSNNNALVLNPTSSTTTNQIVLYLDSPSVFPSGIKIGSANLTYDTSKQAIKISFV